MKIIDVKTLEIPEVKVVKYARFCDHRGYFTEHYRKSDFQTNEKMDFLKDIEFTQCNESASKKGTIRGLHFQWNPFMGKLVRTIRGRMIDMVMDIRKGSPTFGNIILYDMPADDEKDYGEWIWVPPGFAHGNIYTEQSMIEYFCSGQYSPGCEAGVSPLASDINWELCDPELKKVFEETISSELLMTDKDRNGFSLAEWQSNPNSDNFIYGKL